MIRRVAFAARFWIHRYGPQDVAATLAAVLGALLLSPLTESAAFVAAACACIEWIVFYGVAFARNRRRQAGFSSLVREYGVAEGLDLVLRPGLMHAGLVVTTDAWSGVLLGGLAADVAFYFVAALASGRPRVGDA